MRYCRGPPSFLQGTNVIKMSMGTSRMWKGPSMSHVWVGWEVIIGWHGSEGAPCLVLRFSTDQRDYEQQLGALKHASATVSMPLTWVSIAN